MQPIISHFLSVVVKLSLLSAILGTTPLAQAKITVTNLADSGPGSLRQAIADAASGDTIDFAVTGTITLTGGELAVANDLTIIGPGAASLRLDGNHASRVLRVSNGTVSVSDLMIANGYAPGSGGAIANSAVLTIIRCYITENTAYSIGPSPAAGGIDNGGNLTIVDSTISKNGPTYWAGGIMNFGTLSLTGCVVAENHGTVSGGVRNSASMSASNSTFSGNLGTAILNEGGTLWLHSSTVCFNTGINGRGIINSDPSPWSGLSYIESSIISGNLSGDLAGPADSFVSQDYNLIQDTSGCTITGTTTHNIYGLDPKLGPLADNGGPTLTHALRFNSPAVDAGNSGGLSTDQRGCNRLIDSPDVANAEGGDGSDIGAYETNPNTQMAIYTAVEVEFGTTLGRTYRVESTTDMVTWSQVEAGIVGTGGPVTRLYTIRVIPKRFFRAVQE